MLPTGRGPSDYPASAGVGDCIAVFRRFEEKNEEFLTTEDAEDSEVEKQIHFLFSSVSSESSRSLLRPGGES